MNSLKLNSRVIRECIREIEAIDLAKANEQRLDEIISKLVSGYKVMAPVFKESLSIWRARRCDKPKNISDITFPKPKYINEYGRGNGIGQSMFYGVTARAVPFFELDCQVGDKIALSKWKTQPNLILNHIGFTEETKRLLSSARDLDEIYKFVKNTNNHGDLNGLVHEYLSLLFSRPVFSEKEKLHYKLTSVIANKMIFGDIFHGLMYPTIRMFANADNILLKPEYAKTQLSFVHVEYFVVTDKVNEQYSIDLIDSATEVDDDGNLAWSNRPLQWALNEQGQIATFTVENGCWVAKDSQGNALEKI